ncbi:MAG TPA: translation initiation factor IF-3 [Clostridia bacterium]|nr:translation initiation factor IF-3 [Clostridia bacterium]
MQINEEIREPKVRMVDENGAQLGIMDTRDALDLAERKGLDMVMVSPGANPPVCRLMDYGKYMFDKEKREKEQRKNQRVIENKEIRLSPTIDVHDLEIRAKQCLGFLKSGCKVKVSIKFRGRLITKGDMGEDVMNAFFKMVESDAVMEKAPKQEGRNMFMFIGPKAAK